MTLLMSASQGMMSQSREHWGIGGGGDSVGEVPWYLDSASLINQSHHPLAIYNNDILIHSRVTSQISGGMDSACVVGFMWSHVHLTSHRGAVTRRWHPVAMDTRCDMEVIILANHVDVENDQKSVVMVTEEMVGTCHLSLSHTHKCNSLCCVWCCPLPNNFLCRNKSSTNTGICFRCVRTQVDTLRASKLWQ